MEIQKLEGKLRLRQNILLDTASRAYKKRIDVT
jgi:hypothetical protein